MRKRQTFIITILTPETENASLCGRLKGIASGKTFTFNNLDELSKIISSMVRDESSREQVQPLELSDDCLKS